MSKAKWTPTGPACVLDVDLSGDATGGTGPCSGRVSAIAIDPAEPDKTIYVGSATGGVFKTIDGGLTWAPKMDTAEWLSIGAITVNGGRIIVGTGEVNVAGGSTISGVGILVSSDGGDSWVKRPADDPSTHTNDFTGLNIIRVLVDPAAADHWFAVTTRGLFETSNAGSLWARVSILGLDDRNLSDAVVDTTNPASPILYVAIRGSGIARRAGTAPFETMPGLPATNIGRIALAISSKQPGTLYAAFATTGSKLDGIYATDNGNAAIADVKWVKRGNIPDVAGQTDYNLVIATLSDNPQTVLFGESKLWRSTDGGRKWELAGTGPNSGIHPDQHVLALHPTKPGTVWLGNDGGMWLSTDGGITWAHRNRGLQTLQLYSAAQHPQYESVMLAGTQDNGVVRYEGTGAWRESNGGDAFDTAIDTKDPRLWYYNYVWGNGGFQPFFRSESAGAPGKWEVAAKNLIASDFPDLDNRTKFIIDPAKPSTLYIGSTRLYQSVDSAKTWNPVKTGTGAGKADFKPGSGTGDRISAIAVAPNIIYVGTADGHLWVLTLAGGVWSKDERTTGLPSRYIGDIAVSPADPQKVYVAIGSPHGTPNVSIADGRLFKSSTGGRNWDKLTPNFPTQVNPVGTGFVDRLRNPVNTIAIDPAHPDHIFVACDVGVFRSDDEGATWAWWNENLPNVSVSQLGIHGKQGLIRSATLGRGVWERSLDPAAAPDVDIYLRDNALDIGLQPTQTGTDPFDPSRQAVWQDGLDLKVDTAGFFGGFEKPASTTDYTPGGNIDFIGFDKMPHSNPRKGSNARVYLQVNNRGPKTAKLVKARLFWATKTGGVFPDLPADFWTAFEIGGDLSAGSPWHSIAPAEVIDEVRPAEPGVFSFFWDTSGLSNFLANVGLGPPVGVLAVVTCGDDPVNEAGVSIATIVPANKRILLKEMPVKASNAAIVIGIIAGLGLLAIGGKLLYDELKHK
jgi:photosystem II stability/assembly factor-like uncharacterized protein